MHHGEERQAKGHPPQAPACDAGTVASTAPTGGRARCCPPALRPARRPPAGSGAHQAWVRVAGWAENLEEEGGHRCGHSSLD